MSEWSLQLLPCGDCSQGSVDLLRSLQSRSVVAVNLACAAGPLGVTVLTGRSAEAVNRKPPSVPFRAVASASPGQIGLRLGTLQWRPAACGQLQLCVEVLHSEDLAALQRRCAVNFGLGEGSGANDTSCPILASTSLSLSEPPCVVLGTTHSKAARAVLQRLESWWRERCSGDERELSVRCDAIAAVHKAGAVQAPLLLGRAAAVRRGMLMLSGLPQPPWAMPLQRSCSTLPPTAHARPQSELETPPRVRRAASVGFSGGGVRAQAAGIGRPLARARQTQLDASTWAVGLTLAAEHPALLERPRTRFHFVLDNSASMGRQTEQARTCFSELVAVANGPCSLTVFSGTAVTLGESFTSPASMRAAVLPQQGGTNISDGVAAAVRIVTRCEESDNGRCRIHHVLVLLSDGHHNRGPLPREHLPELGRALRRAAPSIQLSVVVVGVTSSSDTSIGMLLKQSLETVALPSLEPIYFAATPHSMGEALAQMHQGLAGIRGGLMRVSVVDSSDECGLVSAVGEAPAQHLRLHAQESERALIFTGTAPPQALLVDGSFVRCTARESAADFDSELAAAALEELMEGVRLRRVANGAESVRGALRQLTCWTSAMEARLAAQRVAPGGEPSTLRLAGAGPCSRVAQHKAAMRALHGARELRNQLADIEALRTNDSAGQAAFLTGARSKYGAKALRRAAATPAGDAAGGGSQLQNLLADVERVAGKMRTALREDLCAKLTTLTEEARQGLRIRLAAELPPRVPRNKIDAICFGAAGHGAVPEDLALDNELAELVDGGLVARLLWEAAGAGRRSYLSLQTAWEQLREWCEAASDAASICHTEYELLMYLGTLGHPIEVQRRAATQMNPFAMEVTRVRAACADTASLCCALRSEQPVVPPEGGTAVEDVLVLVDPDVPRASRLAAFSTLLGEVYSSVVLCRDLHMYTGRAMRVALHGHSLLASVQPGLPSVSESDLEAQLRRQYAGRAYQCSQCSFGPIDHFACDDLLAHHGEHAGRGARINNACPRCGWFSSDLQDWPKWDGTVPKEALQTASMVADVDQGYSAAMLEVALRICYSARAFWRPDTDGDAQRLCVKLAQADEPLTAADGVDHPVQLLLALAICDDVPHEALETPSVMALLNEVCARRARDELRICAGTDESAVAKAARHRVAQFLGVAKDSSPDAAPVDQPEPPQEAVRAACRTDYAVDGSDFNYRAWISEAVRPWVGAMIFVRRLREHLGNRSGGWEQLGWDLETGPRAYADVIDALRAPPGPLGSLAAWLDVQPRDLPQVCAAMAAQAFLHHSSQLRRVRAVGGTSAEPLGDVRRSTTLQEMVVDLRMSFYMDDVASKVQEWHRVGTDITIARARACDIAQYSHMCGSHVHGLSKEAFWGLWRAAKADGHNGEKVREFLRRANQGFQSKHG